MHSDSFDITVFLHCTPVITDLILFMTALFSGPGRAPGNPRTLFELYGSQRAEQPLQLGPGELSLGYGSSRGPGYGQPGYPPKLECTGEPLWRRWEQDYLILLNGHSCTDMFIKSTLYLFVFFKCLKQNRFEKNKWNFAVQIDRWGRITNVLIGTNWSQYIISFTCMNKNSWRQLVSRDTVNSRYISELCWELGAGAIQGRWTL